MSDYIQNQKLAVEGGLRAVLAKVNDPTVPQVERDVNASLTRLEKACESLLVRYGEIDSRLTPILRYYQPCENKKDEKASISPCALAHRINVCCLRLEEFNESLLNMIKAIQL